MRPAVNAARVQGTGMTAVNAAVRGRVQGVGFRPFVFGLAAAYQLKGTVQNNMDGVKIHLEGEAEQIQAFFSELRNKAPRLARIDELVVEEAACQNLGQFTISESERSGTSQLVLPIDSAVCDDCLTEMNDPDNFRYHYPFINCTQCGPRYTIIEELPYDRPYTTMKGFLMCPDCQKEYDDPANRRHHAQPIACPKCGPKVKLLNREGQEIGADHPISETIELLKAGNVLAVKGIGGYHLCCDPRNDEAVAVLRKRKNRPLRPLAVMAAGIGQIAELAEVAEMERELLKSPEAPIVILRKKTTYDLANQVAPGMETIGVMLPYSPLHHLLLADPELPFLVMTSANPSGMPILYQDQEALAYLEGIADYYLVHNRKILHPVDDSVIQVTDGKLDFIRRSRGYVPDPIATDQDVSGIIAFGGQQKATFTIGRNKQIFIGPYIGDLENIETITHYKNELEHLLKWIDTPKSLAAIDAHPGYYVRQLASEYDFEKVIEVQHHHAHMAACLDEHGETGSAYGIILDGTGYGFDGNIWGFEIFYGDTGSFKRMAHLHYTPLPGSEKCIREPWRNAAAMLMSLLGEEGLDLARQIFKDKAPQLDVLKRMIETNVNTVYAGTCGRLFDAVSAICGVTTVSSYDGEAAIRLSELVDEHVVAEHHAEEHNVTEHHAEECHANGQHTVEIHTAGEHLAAEPYPYQLYDDDGLLTFDFSQMLKAIALGVLAGRDAASISHRFHETVAQALVDGMVQLRREHPESESTVVLSGGSMHNRFLRNRLTAVLTERGFNVLLPEKVPCNDGGVSYGQLVVAAAKRRNRQCV
jgi:hydrogenase maturation protein HypF